MTILAALMLAICLVVLVILKLINGLSVDLEELYRLNWFYRSHIKQIYKRLKTIEKPDET